MTSDAAPTIAIVGAGEMGSAIGACLVDEGFMVTTSLEGRSQRTAERARNVGMVDAGSLESLLSGSDLLLSILPPSSALEFATMACPLLGTSDRDPLFVDCNAVSPTTLTAIRAIADSSGVRFQDVGIIGAAPQPDRVPVRFFTSGPFTGEVEALATELIDVRPVGVEAGRASALKMVYASLTKGTHALRAAAMMAAVSLGVQEEICEEWAYSLPDAYRSMQKRMPRMPLVAGRWSGEMREIADTYRTLGLTPAFHEGAGWVYDLLAKLDQDGAPPSSVEQLATAFVALLEEGEPAT